MNATPRVALLPLIIIWLGIGIPSKVGIIFLGAVFPMLINARDGVKTTPQNLLNAARSFGASEWQIFRSVVFPSTVPFILTGLRLGVGRALVGVLVGELYAATPPGNRCVVPLTLDRTRCSHNYNDGQSLRES